MFQENKLKNIGEKTQRSMPYKTATITHEVAVLWNVRENKDCHCIYFN